MTRYITNGVLVRLHYQKAGQHSSRRKAQAFVLGILCLIVIPLAIYNLGDGGKAPDAVYRIVPPVFGSLGVPPSSSAPSPSGVSASPVFFPVGYVGRIRIVAENRDPVLTQVQSLELPPASTLAPEVPSSLDLGSGDYGRGPLSVETDFGLPDPPPMWTFTSRGLPSGVRHENVGSSAQVILAEPVWPVRAWPANDTAVVEGWLTLHSSGRMSFELISETPPGYGFGAAVQTAIEHGFCVPATDSHDNRTTVRCRYRCLFVEGAEPAVSVDGIVSASVRKKK